MSKRKDGYHDLETCFYPVPLNDVLEVVPAQQVTTMTTSGIPFFAEGENLCEKAYELLQKDFDLPPVDFFLYKKIPVGAGLGGGSSDGAFALLLLNEQFNLGLKQQTLLDYALKLGSDCPFFILGKTCVATGRGEVMQPITLNLSGYHLVLICTGIHVSTRNAFFGIVPQKPAVPISEILTLPPGKWEGQLQNDFEASVFSQTPLLKVIKEELYRAGAAYAAMTGSGSSIYGLFDAKPNLSTALTSHNVFEFEL